MKPIIFIQVINILCWQIYNIIMDINETYKNSGLGKWFDEKWVDISRKDKSGKHPPCGASSKKGSRKGDQKKAYPKCRPAKKAAAMSPELKEKATDQKRRAEKKNPHHKGRKPVMVSHENLSEGKNLPNNPKLWAQSKAKAKRKFDVYPCLPVSYPALTKDGWKYVNELKVGDEIAAFDLNERIRKFVKIENIHIHKNAPVHEIYTDGHYFCTSTLDHKWVVEQNDQLLLESTMGFQSYTKLFVDEGMPLLSNFEIHPSGNEMVWCPETSLGTWVTNINDQPCVTGNSAYANAWAAKDYKKHGGTWRKSKKKYMLKEHNMPSFNEWLEKRENQ